jgi:amino acid adenylation domain-containing protein
MRTVLDDRNTAAAESPRAAPPASSASPAAPSWLDGKYVFPASSSQRQLWFLHELDAGAGLAYHIPVAFWVSGPVDRVALQRAVNWTVARHEALRTRVGRFEGDVVQAIAPEAGVTVAFVDLADHPQGSREHEARRRIEIEANRPFHHAEHSLLRVSLIRLADDRHALLIVLHHIIADGTSLETVVRELVAAYDAFVHGDVPVASPPALQYADYVAWQDRWLRGDDYAAQRAYWVDQLAGAPMVLELALGRRRTIEAGFRGRTHVVALRRPLEAAVRAAAAQHGVSLYTMLLAAFAVVLYRRSGQTDLLIGTPVANRRRPELDRLVGLFANTVVVRVDFSADPTAHELVQQVSRTVAQAIAHQEVPFDKLVEALQPERALTRNPVFQVMFAFQEVRQAAPATGPLALERLAVASQSARFDLSLFATDEDGAVSLAFEHNAALFDPATIEHMAEHYQGVLAEMVGGDVRTSGLSFITPDERRELIERAYHHEPAPDADWLVQSFERIAAETPDRIALVHGDRALTYRELNRLANQLAGRLRARGAGPEQRVAVMCERSAQLVIALVAVLKAGAAYVPIDPELPEDRIRYILDDARPSIVITASAVGELDAARLPARDPAVVVDGRDDRGPAASAPAASDACAAYVLYTSGSTGRPKGVVISRGALGNFLGSMLRAPGLAADDVLAAVTTVSFDIAGLELFLPLVAGARVVLVDRETARDAQALRHVIEQHQVTVLQSTPGTWRMLLDTGWRPGPAMRVLCGGEALAQDLADRLVSGGAAVWNLYGPTETTIWSCRKRVERSGQISIGAAIGNTGAYVLDDQLEPVPAGVQGELCISGAGVGRGYWARPALTAEAFVPDPFARAPGGRLYRTGDIVVQRPDGELEFIGRRDHQVKVRGFRVELGEIEATAREHAGVRDAVAVVTGSGAGARLVCHVVAEAGRDAAWLEALRLHLRSRLPEYMVPAAITTLDALPRQPSGKVDRAALPRPESARTGEVAQPPTSDVELRLASAWARILDCGPVSLSDNFFTLGGTSLQAARLVQEVRRELHVEIPMRDLYFDATLSNLAAIVDRKLRGIRAERTGGIEPFVAGLRDDQLDALLEDSLLNPGWEARS